MGTDMTTILVGGGLTDNGPTTFMAHKALLMTSSAFFAMSLSGGFSEARSGIVELPEEDPEFFSTFVHYVYFGRLFSKTEATTHEDDEEWCILPRLYTLGERLDAPKFRDAVVSGVIDKVIESNIMPADWAEHVYGHTVAPCPLRRLIVDFHVFVHKGKLLKKGASVDTQETCPEFLQDAMHRMIDLGKDLYEQNEYPWVVNPCRYHEHGEAFCEEDHRVA